MKHTIKIILLGIFSMLFMLSNAQEDVKMTAKEQRKAEKAKKKKEKEEKEAADWLVFQKLAQERKFVIELNELGNSFVSRRLNFLYVNGEDIILQFELNQYIFYAENGLGGRTVEGKISNYKYKPPKNDKKPIFINFDIKTKLDQQGGNISITIYQGGIATVSFGSGKGIFLPVEEANINIGVDMWN